MHCRITQPRKEEILTRATMCTNLKGIMLSETSQSQKTDSASCHLRKTPRPESQTDGRQSVAPPGGGRGWGSGFHGDRDSVLEMTGGGAQQCECA